VAFPSAPGSPPTLCAVSLRQGDQTGEIRRQVRRAAGRGDRPAAGGCFDAASGKTKFDVSFVVVVVVDKVECHPPLYRQAETMAREGLPIHRSSLHHLYGRRSGSTSCTSAWTSCFWSAGSSTPTRRPSGSSTRAAASELDLICQLYKIEAEAKRRSEKLGTEKALFQERKTSRGASAGLARSFFALCRRRGGMETPGSPLRKAAAYALRLEKALSLFLEEPRLNIDNNPAENAIRPVAIGRKNWLFVGGEGGGRQFAILRSLATTCEANGVNFRSWMEDVLPRLGATPAKDVDSLLPHLWKPAAK